MTLRPVCVLVAAAVPLAACATEPQSTPASEAPAAVAVGEPENCVSTNLIRNTRVHDDRTIDFEMANGIVYRNTLPGRCSGLGFEERFSYRTTIGRLCNTDTITVLHSGGVNGPTCGLGQFVPVRYAEGAAGR